MSHSAPSAAAPADGADAHDPAAAIGRTERVQAVIAPEKVAALAATLDLDPAEAPRLLPPGWHWMFFNPFVRRSALGEDGHPKRGGFLPDVGLPRRMWAGGRLTYHSPLPVGVVATRESTILDVSAKSGRSGRLVFVTVGHRISHDGETLIAEEQDLVYREAAAPGGTPPKPAAAPEGATWSETVEPDPVLLFRYSALTANGHRIHYDRPYATTVEHYRDLVVHGPLTATLLQDLAVRARPGRRLATFAFRGAAPLFVDAPFHIEAKAGTADAGQAGGEGKAGGEGQAGGDGPPGEGAALSLWARGPDGGLAMRADATFADG